jgi:hypothetical protein
MLPTNKPPETPSQRRMSTKKQTIRPVSPPAITVRRAVRLAPRKTILVKKRLGVEHLPRSAVVPTPRRL